MLSNRQKKLLAAKHINQGNVLLSMQDASGAIEFYDNALEINSYHAMAYFF